MSSELSSREALDKKEFSHLPKEASDTNKSFKDWTFDPINLERLKGSPRVVRATHEKKWDKFYPEIAHPAGRAPAIVNNIGDKPKAVSESGDTEYYSHLEKVVGKRINTIDNVLEEIPDPPANHPGPFIECCVGRNPETHKMMVVKLPAREIKVRPEFVIKYNGSVVMDTNATHSASIVIGGERRLYVFDRFFDWGGKSYDRCCYIPDRVHQAGILFETFSDKTILDDIARLRQLPGTSSPAYMIVGLKNKEQDVRDLKRLHERHFLGKKDNYASRKDPAMEKLLKKIQVA